MFGKFAFQVHEDLKAGKGASFSDIRMKFKDLEINYNKDLLSMINPHFASAVPHVEIDLVIVPEFSVTEFFEDFELLELKQCTVSQSNNWSSGCLKQPNALLLVHEDQISINSETEDNLVENDYHPEYLRVSYKIINFLNSILN